MDSAEVAPRGRFGAIGLGAARRSPDGSTKRVWNRPDGNARAEPKLARTIRLLVPWSANAARPFQRPRTQGRPTQGSHMTVEPNEANASLGDESPGELVGCSEQLGRRASPGHSPRPKEDQLGATLDVRFVQHLTAIEGDSWSLTVTRPSVACEPGTDETAGHRAVICGFGGGQGRGRTADLPIFSRTLVPTELPGQAPLVVREAGDPDGTRTRDLRRDRAAR